MDPWLASTRQLTASRCRALACGLRCPRRTLWSAVCARLGAAEGSACPPSVWLIRQRGVRTPSLHRRQLDVFADCATVWSLLRRMIRGATTHGPPGLQRGPRPVARHPWGPLDRSGGAGFCVRWSCADLVRRSSRGMRRRGCTSCHGTTRGAAVSGCDRSGRRTRTWPAHEVACARLRRESSRSPSPPLNTSTRALETAVVEQPTSPGTQAHSTSRIPIPRCPPRRAGTPPASASSSTTTSR